jgi:hypothetical protein
MEVLWLVNTEAYYWVTGTKGEIKHAKAFRR